MNTVVSRLLSVIGCAFIFSAAWFCLWVSVCIWWNARIWRCCCFPLPAFRADAAMPGGYWPVLLEPSGCLSSGWRRKWRWRIR